MMSLRDKETPNTTKQVGTSSSKPTCSSSRQWSGLKNPRIVRVSRTFGGKDRHSKVCTIKGLRDRRIRLSVPTAIQLYDLQDRLGLNQPSKVIDWLLDTTKNDIDKLPPLPIVPGVFAPFHHQDTHSSHGYGGSQPSTTPFLDMHLSSKRKEGINFDNNSLSVGVNEGDQSLLGKFKYWDSSPLIRSMQKGVDHHGGVVGECNSTSHISAQNFFPIARGNATSTTNLNQTTPNLLSSNNNPMYNYYHQWEPSNLSLTQLGSHGLSSQNDHQGNSTSQPPSSLSLSSGSQLFLYPPMATPSLFPPHTSYMNSHHQVEDESRQLNRFRSSNPTFPNSSNSSGVRSFSFSINHQPHLHQQNNENNQEKR